MADYSLLTTFYLLLTTGGSDPEPTDRFVESAVAIWEALYNMTLLTTYYLLHAPYYILLTTTYYLLLTTDYVLLSCHLRSSLQQDSTYYLLPTTYYLLPTTYYILRNTYYLILTTY